LSREKKFNQVVSVYFSEDLLENVKKFCEDKMPISIYIRNAVIKQMKEDLKNERTS